MLRRLQLLYFFRFLGDALFYPFMSLYLLSRGIEGGNLGLILGVLPLITIIANFFFSFVKIKHRYDRLVLTIMLLLEGLLIFVYGFNLTYLLFVIITVFLGFMNAPYYSLLDAYTTNSYISSEEYPRVRIMGSIAYIFGGAFGGILIDKIGYFYVFLIAFISYILSYLFLVSLKKVEVKEDNNQNNKTDYKEVFNRGFIIYILFYVLILGSNNVFDSYFNVFLDNLHYDVTTIGIINSLVIISETIMMFIMIRVLKHKINLKKFLLFCGITLFVKDLLFAFPLPNILLIVIALLRGVGWGGILAVNIVCLTKLVKQNNIAFALLSISTVMGIFRGVANYIVGDIYLKVGFSPIFFTVAMLQLVGILLLFFSKGIKERLDYE